MSYCRFSSCGFKCDVYVYESGDDVYTIHVADSRLVGPPEEPECPKFDGASLTAAALWIERCTATRIGLPFDGATFNVGGLDNLDRKLRELRSAGYRVPDFVLQLVADEIEEEKRREARHGHSGVR